MDILRRLSPIALGLVAALPLALPVAPATGAASDSTVVLQTTIDAGTVGYVYLPFEMPDGIRRVDVSVVESPDISMGVGIFDQMGPGYGSAGFRGVFGSERSSFFIEGDEATEAFLPGPLEPGTWTVFLAVYRAATASEVTVTVTLTEGTIDPTPAGQTPRRLSDEKGWYRGDLHVHTNHSSDAFNQGAPSPAGVADAASQAGLDFVSLTDHNVVSQNLRLRADARKDLLLIGGEEMTNWFFGHATVTGLAAGEWVDFRQRPQPEELEENEGRYADFLTQAGSFDTYVAIAHPDQIGQGVGWDFFDELTPESAPDGIEVWNASLGSAQNLSAIAKWDELLQQGYRIFASGGSDSHGLAEDRPQPGYPTTAVYAKDLSERSILRALDSGRMYVSETPGGPAVILIGRGLDGRRTMSGGTITGSTGDLAKICVKTTKARGYTLSLWSDGAVVAERDITKKVTGLKLNHPITEGGYIRAELVQGNSTGSRTLKAISNPIFFQIGDGSTTVSPGPSRPKC